MNKKINKLELICLDYIIVNLKQFDIDAFDPILKEKVLNRLLNSREPNFSYRGIAPQPSISVIERLVDPVQTTSLDLSNIPIAFNSNVKYRFFDQCKSLRSITLTRSPSLSSQGVLQFLQLVGGNLTSLTLAGCMKLNDQVIQYISFYCGNLKELNLEDCVGISGMIFQRAIASTGNKLTLEMMTTAASNSGLFMKKMESLVSLNLNGCKSINVKNLLNMNSVFPNLLGFSFGKTFLSDEDGALLVQTLPRQIKSLDLSFNPIGKWTLKTLVASSYQLKSICLGFCRCIAAIDLANLLIGLKDTLEYLSIPGCFQIDKFIFDNETRKIFRASHEIALKTIDISHCTQFIHNNNFISTFSCKESLEILRYNNQGFVHQFSLK